MFFQAPLEFVTVYVDGLSDCLAEHDPKARLTPTQKDWLSFCLMGILVTNSVCWARFERASLGDYQTAALSYMFRHSPLCWEQMFQMSIRFILKKYNITKAVLLVDDTDKK